MTVRNLEEYAESQGICVQYYPLPDGVHGASRKNNEHDYDVLINAALLDMPAEYQKMYLAHEIGHCVKDLFCCNYNRNFMPLIWRLEFQAWKEAVLTLVPENEILRAVRREGLYESWELADYFDVPDELMQFAICYYRKIPYNRFW